MERKGEKAPTIRKPQNNLDDSSDILSSNKFVSLNTEEIDEDEDCNGNINKILPNFDESKIKNKSKASKKKNVRKKKKLQTKRIETIKSSFDCKESTETFNCHICYKMKSKLKAKNDKRNQSETEKEIGLLDLDTLRYCIAFLEFKHDTGNNSSTYNEENKSHRIESIRLSGGAGNFDWKSH